MVLAGGLIDIAKGRTTLQSSNLRTSRKIISIGFFDLLLESRILCLNCFETKVKTYLTSLYPVFSASPYVSHHCKFKLSNDGKLTDLLELSVLMVYRKPLQG